MALKPADMWRKIKAALHGKPPAEQMRALRGFLADWPDYRGEYGVMKRKLRARLDELERQSETSSHGHAQEQSPFEIRKAAHALIPIVGAANSGKSQLYNAITGGHSAVADYSFTTTVPHWAVVRACNLSLELVDLPAIEYIASLPADTAQKLRHSLRPADLVLLTLDQSQDVTEQGKALAAFLSSLPFEKGAPPGLIVRTKADRGSAMRDEAVTLERHGWNGTTWVSRGGSSEDWISEAIHCLGYIRIYAKAPNNRISEKEPFFIRSGATALEAAAAIRTDLVRNMKSLRVWPAGGETSPARLVPRTYVLVPEDVLEVSTR